MDAPSKASEFFPKLVWKLLGEYRHARRIHLILDNYIIHPSKRTKRFLAQCGDRLALHFLPPYCPDDNRIERVWLDLHANVTRNHRCRTMEELMSRSSVDSKPQGEEYRYQPENVTYGRMVLAPRVGE